MRQATSLALLLLGGCFSDMGGLAASSSGDASAASSTTTDATTSTTDDTTGTTAEPTDGGSSTGEPPAGQACDSFLQNCPASQRCVPYRAGEGPAGQARCVPGTGAQQPGDPCELVPPGLGGVDDCAAGSMCWHLDDLGEAGGRCVALCGGSEAQPVCPTASACALSGEVPPLCLALCDPLVQDCADDDNCVPDGDNFVCYPDVSGDAGAAFDACASQGACDKGLLCLDSVHASECKQDIQGCCLPICDTAAPMCPGVGQTCTPLYEGGGGPAGLENVGVCALPP